MLKRKLLVLMALLHLTGALFAANYQEAFLQANEYYKEGRFEEAEKLYETVPNKGAVVNYNLGNSAYKQGKLGLALAYWRRAEKQWGVWNKGELLYNISLIKKQVFSERGGVFIYFAGVKNKITSFVRSVPIILIQFLFLLVWLFLFIYLKYLYKTGRRFLIVLLFLLVAFLGAVLAIKYSLEFKRHGIVAKDKTQLLSGPDEKFSVLGSIPEALELVIKKESGRYYKVKFHGRIGWIKKEDIVEV